ncbi:MAG: ferrous iron transporter B [Phycisphaerae bacterium]|nr:ferrous iron transporter B [Phycisphaerae bacterium]
MATGAEGSAVRTVALLGNPNTGKTTLFNRLSGLRHKTSNFPGTTQEARVGVLRGGGAAGGAPGGAGGTNGSAAGDQVDTHLVDLPGIYSLELEQAEAEICRRVLAGKLSPKGEETREPDALLIVADATNLIRNLSLVGEGLSQRLPTVVVVTMVDLARRMGVRVVAEQLEEQLGCPVVLCNARSGEGAGGILPALDRARVSNRTPPGDRDALERWAENVYSLSTEHSLPCAAGEHGSARWMASSRLTDRLDNLLTHPVSGLLIFAAVMAGLFVVIFKLAAYPMDWIEVVFARLGGLIESAMPEGILREFLAQGVVGGIGATVIFLPQICLLFFLISILEDTGYLARAAFLMDRVLRPFGLPGHSFVPFLSSHACALPGIMSARAIPDRREKLATILVAPFMTCSARIPVYVLMISILFRDRPIAAGLAFVGCYALGIGAGLFSALVARRTILRGASRPMALELPTYKVPSVWTAAIATYDRGMTFLKNAGTNILAICVVLWWMSAFPHVPPPGESVMLRDQAQTLRQSLDGVSRGAASQGAVGRGAAGENAGGERVVRDGAAGANNNAPVAAMSEQDKAAARAKIEELETSADRAEARHALSNSFAGKLGRAIEPVFRPLGFDWQLSVGVLTSFAAREVFVSTMAVMVAGVDDAEDAGVRDQIAHATRDDGVTPIFTTSVAWSALVFYVLAMQCLPTLAVTAREAGGVKWAVLQLAWMSGVAYLAAWLTVKMVG